MPSTFRRAPERSTDEADYRSKLTHETFGFLAKFTAEDIEAQIAYIIAQGWNPAIEHEYQGNALSHYWTMWKLPFFGEQNLDNVLDELDACRRAYPDHVIRVVGYDNYAQCLGHAFVVHEGRG